MDTANKRRFPFYLDAGVRIFSFFFSYGRKARRTKVFYAISLFPAFMAAVIKVAQFFASDTGPDGMQIFANWIMVFYLQFFVLILSLFFGTSVCSEEVEGKTLTYLTTRPIPKPAIVIGKYTAYFSLAAIMTAVGMTLSYFILNMDHLLEMSLYPILFRDIGVMGIGIACYMAFFALIGTLMKKSILFGLVISFGWENVIQYFPGSTQRFAIVHYLKSLLPTQYSGNRFSILLFQLESTSPGTAVVVLLALTVVFLTLASYAFANKEYVLQD